MTINRLLHVVAGTRQIEGVGSRMQKPLILRRVVIPTRKDPDVESRGQSHVEGLKQNL